MFQYIFSSKKLLLSIYSILIIFLYFHHLASYPLIDPDEGRYHEIAVEMIKSGDYITPYLNGVLYFEKPILQYWLTAFFMNCFGISEFSGRIAPALFSLGTIFLTYILGKKIFSFKTGLLSSGILATSAITLVVGSMNILDMGLTFFVTLSLVAYFYFKRSFEKKYLYLFYIAMALGLLQKGLVGLVLPLLVIFFDGIFTRNLKIYLKLLYLPAIFVGVLVAFPWFYLVSVANPDFPYFFFIHEHFLRYTTTVHHRYHPFWFFIPFIFVGLTPYAGYLINLFSKDNILRDKENKDLKDSIYFLLIWFFAILIFFSISDSKLVPYIMPCFIPLSILIAGSIYKSDKVHKFNKWAIYLNSIWCIIFALGLIYVNLYYHEVQFDSVSHASDFVIISLILISIVIPIFYHLKKKIRCTMTLNFILAFSLALSMQHLQGEVYKDQTSYYISQAINKEKNVVNIINYKDFYHGIVYYTGKRVILADFTGELEFGSKHGDNDAYFINNEEMKRLYNNDKGTIIIVKEKNIDELSKILDIDKNKLKKVQDFYLISNN